LAWIRNNRFDHAGVAQAARKALEINPNNVEAMFRLAQAEENQGHFAPALDLYRRQLELDPLNPDSVQSIADRLAALGQRDEAVANLQRLFGDNIDDAWPLVPIAIQYGRYDEAVRIAGQRTDELFRAAQLARAWAILGDRELAEAWFEQARASHSFGYAVPIPDVFIRLGRVDELVAFTRQTMEAQAMPRDRPLSPAQFQLLTVAAVAQTLTGNFGEAIRYWEWRLEYAQVRLLGNPDEHISALTFLAYACHEIGDQARSRSLLSTALEVADSAREQGVADYPPLTIAVARLHAQLGESDAALDALDQAIAEGWRDYYGESALPMWQSLQPDAGYQDRLARVRADLESMSEEARRNGWAVFPKATGRIRPSLQGPPPGARLPARIAADRT
jgi:tetratricopeptide (TPR) repeat protein